MWWKQRQRTTLSWTKGTKQPAEGTETQFRENESEGEINKKEKQGVRLPNLAEPKRRKELKQWVLCSSQFQCYIPLLCAKGLTVFCQQQLRRSVYLYPLVCPFLCSFIPTVQHHCHAHYGRAQVCVWPVLCCLSEEKACMFFPSLQLTDTYSAY